MVAATSEAYWLTSPSTKLTVIEAVVRMTTIKLKAPECLPAQGVTHAVFKPWKNSTIAFLQQELVNFNFCKGGKYEKWLPYSINNKRITTLVQNDPEALAILKKKEPDKDAKLDELLLVRES